MILECIVALVGAAVAEPVPDWVSTGGKSAKLSDSVHLTGFGVGEGSKGLDQAKQMALGDLAKKITVRIEQQVRDTSLEKDGKLRYEIAAATMASTDVRLSDVAFETHFDGHRTFVLAHVERKRFASDRRGLRDRALVEIRGCLAAAKKQEEEKQEGAALATYLGCKRPIAGGLEHEALARALAPSSSTDEAAQKELTEASRVIDERVRALLKRPMSTPREAADAIAFQIREQGVKATDWTIAPLTYGTTQFSSPFGKQISTEIERAIGQAFAATKAAGKKSAIIKGTYMEAQDQVRIIVTAKEVESGAMLGAAEAALPKDAVSNAELIPVNLKAALEQDKLLAHGEEVTGDLRVEIWTNKGARNLVYSEGDEMKLYLRVNQPAWVRLIYLLASGAKVPIAQAYYVDATKVNRAVEFPDTFEISRPFGVEQIFAVAFTKEPPPLPTEKKKIDGEEYDVVADLGAVVKHRGIKKKEPKEQTAEALVSITTTPR
jgi:hypothetical protein